MNISTTQASPRTWRLIVTGLVSLYLLASCSMKTLYLQLDWIIPQFIEEYLPLDDKQAHKLKLNLQKTLSWHRATQLPEYVLWLTKVEADLKQGLTQEQVNQHTQELEQFWKTFLSYIAEDSALLLYSTRQEQVDTLFKTFSRKNHQYKKKYIDVDLKTLRHQRVVQISDEYERWLGHLEPEQRKLIETAAQKMKPMGQLHLDNRVILQTRLKYLLDTRVSEEKFKKDIKILFSNWENLYTKEYLEAIEYNKSILTRLVVEVAASLSNEQKKYLYQKIDYYINIFNELSIKK